MRYATVLLLFVVLSVLLSGCHWHLRHTHHHGYEQRYQPAPTYRVDYNHHGDCGTYVRYRR